MIPSLRARAPLACVLAALALLPACKENRAGRLESEAAKAIESRDFETAVSQLERIVAEFPGTAAAERAREQIVLYRGLAEAVRRYPSRRAADQMVRVARAVERYHADRGTWPSSLGDLVPSHLAVAPSDPWGRPLGYRLLGGSTGYALECLGSDGVPGGDGEASDLEVRDGRFVKGRAE